MRWPPLGAAFLCLLMRRRRKAPVGVNRPGFGHIAFVVDDVPTAREAVLRAGGKPVGEIVTLATATGPTVTWVYVTDPEGNIIELQTWDRGG